MNLVSFESLEVSIMFNIKKTLFIAFIIMVISFPTCLSVSAAATLVFEDEELYQLRKINFTNSIISYDDELKSITIEESRLLSDKLLNMANKNISSLKGLEKSTQLAHLYANNNNISDLSPLKSLYNLQFLLLNDNNITDISSLENLSNITELQLDNNKITDVSSLSSLTKLDRVFLSGNQINNVSFLSNTKNLTLVLLNNNITNLILGQVNQNSLKTTILPNIFTYAKKVDSKIYTEKDLNLTNCYIKDNEIVLDTSQTGDIVATISIVGGNAKGSSYSINYKVVETPKKVEDLSAKVTYSTLATTTDAVIVTITTNKQIKEISGWNLSSSKLKLTKTYNENTNETISLVDIDGKAMNITINISNIVLIVPDVEKPTEIIVEDNKETPGVGEDKPADNKQIIDNTPKEKHMQVAIIMAIEVLIISCLLIYIFKHNK